MPFQTDIEFARSLDQQDELKGFRDRFIIPEKDGKQLVYFLGNSLGLQPKAAKDYMQNVLNDWASLGVESFFHAEEPWMDYHDKLTKTLATVVGGSRSEVVVMNNLTVNLHLMLVSFYRPTQKRFRIICEAKAFPSDQYAFETHVKHHGFDDKDAVVEVAPREGEFTLRTEDIIATIEKYADETALVLFGGINYYTGQVFDMKAIAAAAKKAGAKVGFDLAHAAGNVELQLHDWTVDFACWCCYKYLNGGPGAIGGVFIHEKNFSEDLPRFAGWWGYDKATRFKMEKGFKPMAGAEGWQLSTPPFLLYATLRSSLDIIQAAGWEKIQAKRKLLNEYLWFLLNRVNNAVEPAVIQFITPEAESEHGCQISMLMKTRGREIYDYLMKNGFMVDWREPDVIRLAPVALYNTFEEVWRFADALEKAILFDGYIA